MVTMKHLFVPYELALKLKEKGFNQPCFGAYWQDNEELIPLKWFDNNNLRVDSGKITAPIYQQVVDWFREKHDFHIFLIGSANRNKNEFCCEIVTVKKQTYLFTDKAYSSLPYYEALNKAIEEALKLI